MGGVAASMILIFFVTAAPAPGRLLSAGPLARPHAELEGLTNCTRCHTAGKRVTADRCLACHERLAARLQEGAGYHAQVQGECIDCHSDHRGVDYQMIRWQPASFDHDSTGYALRDKHAGLDCNRCHTREGTYLGLQHDCLSCHADEHRAQLRSDCLACHDLQGWKPAPAFAHEGARFSLQGRHRQVDCEGCHVAEADSTGASWRRFRPLAFATCRDCHADLHRAQFDGRECTQCHSVDGFKPARIDHQESRFPLQGRHTTLACNACHRPVTTAAGDSVVTYRPLSFGGCADCHADPHGGQFQQECAQCHNVEGWKGTFVDHEQTRFPLRGRHRRVPCVQCHVLGPGVPADTPVPYRGLTFAACGDCHADVHAGQFQADCTTCHQVEGWKLESFDHGRARFTLEGKHAAVDCDRCHPQQSDAEPASLRRWRGVDFAACGDCHADAHGGQFESDCARCHTASGWKPSIFAHERSSFRLDGAHLQVPCADCHKPFATDQEDMQLIRYRPLAGDCGACHG